MITPSFAVGSPPSCLAFDDLELIGDASSGSEAIRVCEKHRPDVILMDLVMPGMDGAATTREIRNR